MTLRVLITGSREFTDRSIIAAAITKVWRDNGKQPLIICHGDARGADRLAKAIARKYPDRLIEEAHPADWFDGWRDAPGPNPGTKRNDEMVALGADICLAFLHRGAKNHGTKHAIGAASRAGIPVVQHWQEI